MAGSSRAPRPLPPLSRLREVFAYDAETGTIVWRYRPEAGAAWNGRQAGTPAGCVTESGYLQIRLDGKGHRYHRVAWALGYEEDPGSRLIDHRNGDRRDNRIANLRLTDHTGNSRNSARQKQAKWPKGVKFDRSRNKFKAQIRTGSKRIDLGRFNTPELAHEAYCVAARLYHGEFARFA